MTRPHPPSPSLRLATPEDARSVAEIHVRARKSAYRDLLPPLVLAAESVDDRHIRWTSRLGNPAGRCWLLSDASGLFGFAYSAPTADEDLGPMCAELYALYLLEEKIGLGIGRLVAAHTIADLEERGFEEVVLWYAAENLRAARFYAAAGFEVDPRVDPLPFGGTGLTKRRLRRALDPQGH